MTFKTSDLSVLAYANNFTLWHYTTVDTGITSTGYFNTASDMLRVNDLMIANIDTGDTPSTIFYIVTGNSGGVVTVAAYS
jgi:hypothetical protein